MVSISPIITANIGEAVSNEALSLSLKPLRILFEIFSLLFLMSHSLIDDLLLLTMPFQESVDETWPLSGLSSTTSSFGIRFTSTELAHNFNPSQTRA